VRFGEQLQKSTVEDDGKDSVPLAEIDCNSPAQSAAWCSAD